MKSIYIIVFSLLLSCIASAQGQSKILTYSNEIYSYEKVFEVPEKTKEQIFELLKTWIITNTKSQANTNFFDDRNSSISTTLTHACRYGCWMDFKVNIDIKDAKYRFSATSFVWHNAIAPMSLENVTKEKFKKKAKAEVFEDVDDNFSKILASIQTATIKKTDW